jgi:hypothetical protein
VISLGLGLAILRQAVHMHGTIVHAESAGPGAGATCVVKLPVARYDDHAGIVPVGVRGARREVPESLVRTVSPAVHQELS